MENALEGARAGRRMHWKESAGRTHWEEKGSWKPSPPYHPIIIICLSTAFIFGF